MKLLEYEAKALLNQSGIPTPRSYVASDTPEFLPVVLKSQVPVGGRGKAGGVVVIHDNAEYEKQYHELHSLAIKGHLPKTLLAEEVLPIGRELYLSLLVDKQAARIVIMANKDGGIDVEDNDERSFWSRAITSADESERIGQELADYYELQEQAFALQDMLQHLYETFTAQDTLLLEINPLILTADGRLVAGDCKLELDDAARFRHPNWSFESAAPETNFVTLDLAGNVATIANGAGLAMATVDAVADAGLIPANFLDIGGGANEASVLAAFTRLLEYPSLKVIIINIFAGITRCDEVARAIIAARDQLADLPPLAVRLAGTNYEAAAELLAQHDIAIQPNLDQALAVAKEHIA